MTAEAIRAAPPGAARRPAPRRAGLVSSEAWLALPATVLMGVLFLAPLLLLLASSFAGEHGPTLANYATVLGDPYYRQVIWNTATYAFPVALLCLAVGYPFAFALSKMPPGLQVAGLIATLLPLTANVIVKAFGWTILLRGSGPVNQLLLSLGLVDRPLRLMFTPFGLYLGTVNILLPFMILPIFAVIRMIGRDLQDAAAVLGAGPFARFCRLTLPLSLPGVIAGFAMVFSLAASAYVIPTLLIGERQKVLTKVIAHHYLVVNDPRLGSALAVLLFVIALTVLLGAARLGRRLRP